MIYIDFDQIKRELRCWWYGHRWVPGRTSKRVGVRRVVWRHAMYCTRCGKGIIGVAAEGDRIGA